MSTATPEDVARYFRAHPLPWRELCKRARASPEGYARFSEWVSGIVSADYELIGEFLSKVVAVDDLHAYGTQVADILLEHHNQW